MLVRMWRRMNLYCWWECKLATTIEITVENPPRGKKRATIWQQLYHSWTSDQRILHVTAETCAHTRCLFDSSEMQSINWWMDDKSTEHVHDRGSSRCKANGKMRLAGKYYTKWLDQSTERQMSPAGSYVQLYLDFWVQLGVPAEIKKLKRSN